MAISVIIDKRGVTQKNNESPGLDVRVPISVISQTTSWYVHPSTGSDTNNGLTAESPLKTFKALSAKLAGSQLKRELTTINVLANVTDANDQLQLFSFVEAQGAFGGQSTGFGTLLVPIRIQGQRTTATFTDPNTLSTSVLTMTSNALSPNPGASTCGLPPIITVSGFDFSPFVGQHVEIISSSVAASVGAIGVIVKQESTGVAWVSPLVQLSTGVPLTANQYPSSGSTFRIYTCTTWAPHFGVGSMPNCAVTFQDIEFTSAARQVSHDQSYFFNGCVVKRPFGMSNGGEAGTLWLYTGCSVFLTAPPAGRTPTQITHTSGDTRWQACGFINVDLRIREGDAKSALSNCVMVRSQIVCGGPNDLNRSGSPFSLILATSGDFGLGMFDWPGPELLAPSPATTRGSSGAAIHLGHGANVSINAYLYGSSSNAGTVGVRVQENAAFYIADRLTSLASASNPPSPSPAYLTSSLRLSGSSAEILLDGEVNHIPYGILTGALAGTVPLAASNFRPMNRWAHWESGSFGRNVMSLKTGAGIFDIVT